MTHKVLVSGRIPQVALEMLRRQCDVTMHDDIRLISKDEMTAKIKDKDALLCLLSDNVDASVINAAPRLKVIANYGAGFNNIDVQCATARKIPVTNTPAVSTDATADLTIGLIIAIARRLVEGDKLTRAGKFTGWAPLFHLGVEVSGKTLGIFGMGHIGQAVAKRARGFDMRVIYNSRHQLPPDKEKELGATYVSWPELLKQADFLSLHASYGPSLHHIINAETLAAMKRTAFLISAARGAMVDEAALLTALREKRIAGAALDVYEFEPQVTPGLAELDNVILSPHLGNATVETRAAMAEIAARNILQALAGERPINCVNAEIYA